MTDAELNALKEDMALATELKGKSKTVWCKIPTIKKLIAEREAAFRELKVLIGIITSDRDVTLEDFDGAKRVFAKGATYSEIEA